MPDASPLPSLKDFVPWAADPRDAPDAFDAWKRFGGKTVKDVGDSFCPDFDLEPFMWMGERAFKFYFPVIDFYLRSGGPLEDDYLRQPAEFAANCIQMHFDCHEDMTGLHEPILSLCDHVAAHPNHYSLKPYEQSEIAAAWSDLRAQVSDDARGIRRPRK